MRSFGRRQSGLRALSSLVTGSPAPAAPLVPKRRGRPPKVAATPSPPAAVSAAPLWSWVPPSNLSDAHEGDEVIPIKPRTFLTSAEVRAALERLGGEDVAVIALPEKLDTIAEFVLVSGRSGRQIRKMADAIVQAVRPPSLPPSPPPCPHSSASLLSSHPAHTSPRTSAPHTRPQLKSRSLQVPGATGAEGERDDDWLLIDCGTLVVHLMLPATRLGLDLEGHWAKGRAERSRLPDDWE